MVAILVLILTVLMGGDNKSAVVTIPPMPQSAPVTECICDECCYYEAVIEYADEFTALFNSYEVKRAKNGALMIRRGNSGSFKFARKG